MIIDSYSLYLKEQGKKSKYVLKAFSALYEPLHRRGKRSPEIPLYLTPKPQAVQCHSKREPALSLIGTGSAYYSGLYIPDIDRPELAYGDMGEDALLVMHTPEQIEVFVCKGRKPLTSQLFSILVDGDPDLLTEMEAHRQRAAGQSMEGDRF